MTNRKMAFNRGVAIATGLMLLTVGLNNAGWADQHIRNLKRPLTVQLQSPVNGNTATVGQPFEASLSEPVHYKNLTLPAGTHFKGHISKMGHSKHFGRPGYVVLQTDEATLPNGQALSFDPAKYPPREKDLHYKYAETFLQSVVYQLPYNAVSAGVTVPLHYAADVAVGPLIAVGEGIRILTGAIIGPFRPRFKNEPMPRKIALGALDGSGFPRLVGFIDKYPEPEYQPGDLVKLYLNPNGLNDLFRNGQSAVTPLQPK